ncbi:MAG: squalene/phytoene synthase family protein [Acidobacteriia bacterium]|nr:squalene/phytoene synthase family protein [Terriglobia bacterium]
MPNTLEGLYAQAAEATRSGSRTFFFATRFFPPELARAAHAAYWFALYTRSLGRQAARPEIGRLDLDRWEDQVKRGLRGQLVRNPVLEVFLDATERHKIPHRFATDLIEGARMDLNRTSYQNFQDLRDYCYRTSGTMSVLMAHLIGYRGPAPEYMADLGLAMELTSILRTVGNALARGRIYLPLDEIEAFGYSEAELQQHKRNSAFRTLMGFQAERARSYYRRVAPGLDLLDRRGRFAVRVAYDLSVSTLSRIEASDFDVFQRRPNVPVVERYWITARSLAVPMTKRLWRSMSA